jgi:hypothetical protein
MDYEKGKTASVFIIVSPGFPLNAPHCAGQARE